MADALEALRDGLIHLELLGIHSTLERLREDQWEQTRLIAGEIREVGRSVEELRDAVEWQTMRIEVGFATLGGYLDRQVYQLGQIQDDILHKARTEAFAHREYADKAQRAT